MGSIKKKIKRWQYHKKILADRRAARREERRRRERGEVGQYDYDGSSVTYRKINRKGGKNYV